MSMSSNIPPDGPDRRSLGAAASMDWLHDLFDPISASLLVVDRDQRIVLTNPLFDDTLEISRDAVMGKPGKEVLRCGLFPRRSPDCSAGRSRCVACEAWEIARLVAGEKEVKKSSICVEIEVQDTVHSMQVELRAAALRMGGERFTMLALEGLDRVRDFELWADERGIHGILGTDPKMFQLFEDDPPRGPGRRANPHPGRERLGQGDGGRRRCTRRVRRKGGPHGAGQLWRAAGRSLRERALRTRQRRLHRRPAPQARDVSSSRAAARSSSTRSAS